MFLSGAAAAGGIALINSLGNLGGFAGPYLIGWVKDATGSYAAAMGIFALAAIVAALVMAATARGMAARAPVSGHSA